MKKRSNAYGYLAAVLPALLLSACTATGNKTTVDTVDAAMLSDKEAVPVSHALIRLQERPTFPVDERNRGYAMLADRDGQRGARDKPVSIRESNP